MDKINEGYGLGFALDFETHDSMLTVVKRSETGDIQIIGQIHGLEAEALYTRLIVNGQISILPS